MLGPVLLFHKPYMVQCKFSDSQGRPTLANWILQPNFYPAGRLDADSEGLVILTDQGAVQHAISHPRHKLPKTYWVQVEGKLSLPALQSLRTGVVLSDGLTLPAPASEITPNKLWPRDPPIRFRKNIPTSWLELVLQEGRNRQVRRMTARVGFPTLRLIRWAIGPWTLQDLQPGQFRWSYPEEWQHVLFP